MTAPNQLRDNNSDCITVLIVFTVWSWRIFLFPLILALFNPESICDSLGSVRSIFFSRGSPQRWNGPAGNSGI